MKYKKQLQEKYWNYFEVVYYYYASSNTCIIIIIILISSQIRGPSIAITLLYWLVGELVQS